MSEPCIPPPPIDWRTRPLVELVDHLIEHHHAFARRELDRTLAHAAEALGAERAIGRRPLRPLVEALRTDLVVHMQREEAHLFVLVRGGANAADEASRARSARSASLPAHRIAGEHAITQALLRRIEITSQGLAAPDEADAAVRELYAGLIALVADIRVHLDLEETVLLPAIEASAHPAR